MYGSDTCSTMGIGESCLQLGVLVQHPARNRVFQAQARCRLRRSASIRRRVSAGVSQRSFGSRMTCSSRRRLGDHSAPADDVVLQVALELDAVVAGIGEAGGQRLDLFQRAMARPGADANFRLNLRRPANRRAAARAAWRTRPKSHIRSRRTRGNARSAASGAIARRAALPISRSEMFSTMRQSWSRYSSPRPTVPSSR